MWISLPFTILTGYTSLVEVHSPRNRSSLNYILYFIVASQLAERDIRLSFWY